MAYSQIIKKMLIAALFTAACITAQAQGIFIYSSYMSIPQASTPTFSPVAGSYSGTQTVTISASTGGVICYNTTGSPATNGIFSVRREVWRWKVSVSLKGQSEYEARC